MRYSPRISDSLSGSVNTPSQLFHVRKKYINTRIRLSSRFTSFLWFPDSYKRLLKMTQVLKLLMMISFLCFAAAYMDSSTFPAEVKKLAKYFHDLCTDITGTTDEQIQQVQQGNFPDDERVKRYALCLWRKSVMDVNMKVNAPYLKELVNKIKPAMLGPLKECLEIARNSGYKEKYEIPYAIHKCWYEADPENFVFY
ncbi:hypothetical protein JTB14_018109 [Gonioctena quinquepunctata]|nr:hypothetical protein JTB14_018109 [Gonioctena quinquepunctata]